MARDKEGMITGLFPDRQSAECAYAAVGACGYARDEISVLISEEGRSRHYARPEHRSTELGTKAAEGAGAGAVAGGTLGAVLLGLAAAGFAVPGLPIIAMGPLAAALTGAGGGGALGALIGGLIGAGIPEEHARLYDEGLKRGGIVLGATPRTEADADTIEREWRACGAERIHRPERVTRPAQV
jgi:hypothetical protein